MKWDKATTSNENQNESVMMQLQGKSINKHKN